MMFFKKFRRPIAAWPSGRQTTNFANLHKPYSPALGQAVGEMACSLGSNHVSICLCISYDWVTGGFADGVTGNQVARAGAGKLYRMLGDGSRTGVVQRVADEGNVGTVSDRHADRAVEELAAGDINSMTVGQLQ